MRFLFLTIILGLLVSGGKSVTECEECTALVDLLELQWGTEKTENCVVEIGAFLCENFNYADSDVCHYIVSDFSEEFVYVMKQILIKPHQICGLMMHNDCGEFVDPFNETWSLKIPDGEPEFKPKMPVSDKNPSLRVLHLTDLHVDMYYTPGLEVHCNTSLCCRPADLNIEVTHSRPDVIVPAGPWGSVGHCDTPYWLVTNMLEHISKNMGHLDYVMVSGDIVSHADWAYTPETHSAMVRNLSNTIRSYFPHTPVYFAVGNHEGVPIDNLAPHFTPKKYHMDWLYESMSESWKGWVPADQEKTLKYNGCYMKKIYKNLRIISLNNVYGDRLNFWLLINQTDPDGTLGWLSDQLLDAEKAGDKVHIVAHIPGSDGEALEGYALNYYKIINRFANTVVGQFFGHTHAEKFYMLYSDPFDPKSTPTNMVYSAPSVTPLSNFFPAYRIYSIDGEHPDTTYQVIDYEEWFFNLTSNNANPDNVKWEPLYMSANQEYGLKGQTPNEYNQLIERMKDDKHLFQKYFENHYRRSRYDGLGVCTTKCRMNYLCEARQFHKSQALCADLNITTPAEKPASLYSRMPSKPKLHKIHRHAKAECKI